MLCGKNVMDNLIYSIHDVFIRPTFVQVKITNFSLGNKKAKLYFCIIIIIIMIVHRSSCCRIIFLVLRPIH